MKPHILVAGIGNILRADDGFGVDVVRKLTQCSSRPDVEIIDFGIRGIDFAYKLLDGKYDTLIIVDTLSRGEAPGTLYVMEPEIPDSSNITDANANEEPLFMEPHGMDPFKVLKWVKAMGGKRKNIKIVGCEPENLASDEEPEMGLSPCVLRSLEGAVTLIESLIEDSYRDFSAIKAACTN
ncbi:MAG: hydrogenase maturation protease [Bdellovibrionia bacterium]